MHIAVRIRNIYETEHAGNRERYGEYSENRTEIETLVDKLNNSEENI
jgi:hypothetical protein